VRGFLPRVFRGNCICLNSTAIQVMLLVFLHWFTGDGIDDEPMLNVHGFAATFRLARIYLQVRCCCFLGVV